MNKKKVFVTPGVIQEVQVQLEMDLLQGSVQNATRVTSMGMAADYFDFSNEIENNPYTVEWEENN